MANTTNLYEKLHMRICRSVLDVNNRTSTFGIYWELVRYPLYIDFIKQRRRYIEYLDNYTNNVLVQKVYKSLTESLHEHPSSNRGTMDLVSFDNILIQINNGPLRTTDIRQTFQKDTGNTGMCTLALTSQRKDMVAIN
jgi:hypothetical protein